LSGVWGKAKSFNGWGILACDGGFSFMAFVGTPLASLLGYEFGIRGINLGLLPLAVFLGGAAEPLSLVTYSDWLEAVSTI
jgi:hypothetical protein